MPVDMHLSLADYFKQKFGPASAQKLMSGKGHLMDAGQAVGITFNLNRYIINTTKSHCLVDYAATAGKQNEVIESIFHRYFEKAEDISNTSILDDIAKEHGLDSEAAMKHVGDATIVNKIKEEAKMASTDGISGVPFFEVYLKGQSKESCPRFSGAQPPGTFVSLFTRLLKNAKI